MALPKYRSNRKERTYQEQQQWRKARRERVRQGSRRENSKQGESAVATGD